jgi:hypothetical protein
MIHPTSYLVAIRLRSEEIERRAARLGPQLAALDERAHTRWRGPVTVRLAASDDAPELERLAQLDSASLPAAPLLIGECAGRPIAALSLANGALVANPFVPSADVVALLRLRALQLRRERPGLRRRRLRRRLTGLRLLREAE